MNFFQKWMPIKQDVEYDKILETQGLDELLGVSSLKTTKTGLDKYISPITSALVFGLVGGSAMILGGYFVDNTINYYSIASGIEVGLICSILGLLVGFAPRIPETKKAQELVEEKDYLMNTINKIYHSQNQSI